MGITVDNEAKYLCSQYALQSSAKIDESSVSKEKYNVANMTNALDSLKKTDSVNIMSVGDINTYAENELRLSQMDNYDTLEALTTTTTTSLLSGKASLDNIYGLLAKGTEFSPDKQESIEKSAETSNESEYNSYLGNEGSIFNIIA